MVYPGWLRALRGPLTTKAPKTPDPALSRSPHEGVTTPNEPAPAGPLRRSLTIRHVDGGSCNGCESELTLLNSAVYDLSRFGFGFTPSPRHADLLLVTGVVTRGMAPLIRTTYDAMPAPKRVVAVGHCPLAAASASIAAPQVRHPGGLSALVPVDAVAYGCPPSPLTILEAILQAVGRTEELDALRTAEMSPAPEGALTR